MKETLATIGMIGGVKQTLLEWIACEVSEGKEYFREPCVVEAVGQLVDMVKDLSETEEKCMKKKYYEVMTCLALEEDGDPEFSQRMGYDNWRYSDGRYASKGHGHRTGYTPNPFIRGADPYIPYHMRGDMMDGHMIRMGYDDGDPRGSWNGETPVTGDMSKSPRNTMGYDLAEYSDGRSMSVHGMDYDNYKSAKRHYTESHKDEDKMKMNENIEKSTIRAMESLRDMWVDADPRVREKMKKDVGQLFQEMTKS